MSVKGQENILARVYCRTCLTVVATLFHWNFRERPDCIYAVVVFRKNKIVLRRRDGLFGLSFPISPFFKPMPLLTDVSLHLCPTLMCSEHERVQAALSVPVHKVVVFP